MQRFSKRHGHGRQGKEITIREDAPIRLREWLIQTAYALGFSPGPLRVLICRVLRRLPDQNNWSEYPNIAGEVQELVLTCDWFQVYDIIEELFSTLQQRDPAIAQQFQEEINEFFRAEGIGWQLIDGLIETRGDESFEASARTAISTLIDAGRSTASQEMHEALKDLSRRPAADITGAIQHSMVALECVAREISGDKTSTLGKIISDNPHLIPKPLDVSVEKAWGFASEMGRHVREGRTPSREDAELIVGLSAVVATYLVRKLTGNN